MISVIIPIYNAERYVSKCAESILRQTYSDYEVIFVDDCSCDRSLETLHSVIEKVNERGVLVKILRHDANQGVGVARNSGLRAAIGDWCAFVDSDDWVGERYLEDLVSESQLGDLVYAGVSYEKSDGVPYVRKFKKRVFDVSEMPVEDWGVLFSYSFACAKLFDLNLIRRFGVQFSSLPLHEDTAFVFDYLIHAKRVCFTARAEYHYRQDNTASATRKRYSSEIYIQISQGLLVRWNVVLGCVHHKATQDVRRYIQRFGVSQLLLAVDALYDRPLRERHIRVQIINYVREKRKVFSDYYRPSSWAKRIFVFIMLRGPLWIVDVMGLTRSLLRG